MIDGHNFTYTHIPLSLSLSSSHQNFCTERIHKHRASHLGIKIAEIMGSIDQEPDHTPPTRSPRAIWPDARTRFVIKSPSGPHHCLMSKLKPTEAFAKTENSREITEIPPLWCQQLPKIHWKLQNIKATRIVVLFISGYDDLRWAMYDQSMIRPSFGWILGAYVKKRNSKGFQCLEGERKLHPKTL